MTIKTFTRSGALLDTISQALYDNRHGLLDDGASTDDIATLFNNPRFLNEVHSWLSELHPDVIAITDEEIDAHFSNTLTSFAKLFGVEITDYSLDLSAHRPPYIEFSSEEFNGTCSLSTWRQYRGGYDGTLTKSPSLQVLNQWGQEYNDSTLALAIGNAYTHARQVENHDIANAFAHALFTALDNATT